MLENDYGKIVLLSSGAAITPPPKTTDYSASKAAVLAFAYALHLELLLAKKRGVKITAVCPGQVEDTEIGQAQLFPWPNVATGLHSKDVAKKIVDAATKGTFLLMIQKGLRTKAFKKW